MFFVERAVMLTLWCDDTGVVVAGGVGLAGCKRRTLRSALRKVKVFCFFFSKKKVLLSCLQERAHHRSVSRGAHQAWHGDLDHRFDKRLEL